jgi:hypothetical protein
MMQKRSGPRANRALQENVMRKIAIASIAAALVGASALTSLEANAGPNYQPASPSLQLLNKGPIYSPSNPALQPIGNPHGPIVNPAKTPASTAAGAIRTTTAAAGDMAASVFASGSSAQPRATKIAITCAAAFSCRITVSS